MIIKRHDGPAGLRVEFLDDPYTPVMVYLGRGSATFMCAQGEGEVEGVELTREQCTFLDQVEEQANEHYDLYTIHKE